MCCVFIVSVTKQVNDVVFCFLFQAARQDCWSDRSEGDAFTVNASRGRSVKMLVCVRMDTHCASFTTPFGIRVLLTFSSVFCGAAQSSHCFMVSLLFSPPLLWSLVFRYFVCSLFGKLSSRGCVQSLYPIFCTTVTDLIVNCFQASHRWRHLWTPCDLFIRLRMLTVIIYFST